MLLISEKSAIASRFKVIVDFQVVPPFFSAEFNVPVFGHLVLSNCLYPLVGNKRIERLQAAALLRLAHYLAANVEIKRMIFTFKAVAESLELLVLYLALKCHHVAVSSMQSSECVHEVLVAKVRVLLAV